jgi:hypothetical protein
MSMPEMVKQLCPGLKSKAEEAKIFFVNEALLFKHYESEEEKQEYIRYFKKNASLIQKIFFLISKFLISIKAYLLFSNMAHRLFYKPFYR